MRAGAIALLRDAAPPVCLLCQQHHHDLQWLCADCQANVVENVHACQRCGLPNNHPECPACRRSPPPYASTLAPLRYTGSLKSLLHRWKFEGQPHLTQTLVRLAANAWRPRAPIDAIVPVPSHWRRRWMRGFDQTWLLAHAIRHTGDISAPVRPLLRRRRATHKQHRLGVRARTANVAEAFHANRRCAGQHLLLLDDVMTTGATMTAATRALLTAGAASVHLCCLARVEDPADAI